MARTITVAGCDIALANMGLGRFEIDLDTDAVRCLDLRLVTTGRGKGKEVRQNSDDLRRAVEIHRAFAGFTAGCALAFVEVPHGAQNARAATSFGIAIGVLAASAVPIVEVLADEVKRVVAPRGKVAKADVIRWASERFPDAPWLTDSRQQGRLLNANEHLADACAAVAAGVLLPDYLRLKSVLSVQS